MICNLITYYLGLENKSRGILMESLNCPNCGAPLHILGDQTLVVCLYCGSNIRLSRPDGPTLHAEQDNQLNFEELEQIRNLIGAGKRSEAARLYQQSSGIDEIEAEKAINGLASQLSAKLILRQQLSPAGYLLGFLSFLALLASLVAGLTGKLRWLIAAPLVVLFFFQVYPFFMGLLTDIRMWGAKKANAVILRSAAIGRFYKAYTFRAWVEVNPTLEAPFQAEMNLVVREKRLTNLEDGALIGVRYKKADPPIVVYNGKPQV
jgi:hypothetical protein